ncbi:MAG: phospholipase D family protein [Candidatus Margulisbacteria bacterium]|jgi:phosphatidylserine/phosphatidylglycerophosphate/cardiolipin synthase-like enzyme|nr:phospholipase D family protein [Candidatus Margulisiibacteriota bacterium]
MLNALKFVIFFMVSLRLSFAATGNISVYFSPQDRPDKRLITLINDAQKELNIAVYSLTKPDIAQAIVSANERGVTARVLMDKDQAAGRYAKDEYLEGYKISVARDKHKAYMHHKFCVVDGRIVIAGSYNWSDNATHHNDENMLVIESPELAEIFNKEFEKLWMKNK